jgi:F-type H+-transporting ATPase subunit b
MSAKAFAAGASEPGLPQLDIATWPSQLFWLVVLFGAGYLVMAKIVTPRIGAVLEERRQTVDGDLEKARAASGDAAKIRADYESDLEKARIEAAEFAKQAAMEATKKAEAADAKISKKLAEKVGAAEAKLAEAKTSAMANLNDVAAEAAMAAVASLAGIKASSAQASKTASSIATKLAKQETN